MNASRLNRGSLLVLILSLAACRDGAAPPVASQVPAAATEPVAAEADIVSPSPVDEPVTYRCGDGFTFRARYDENEVVLLLGDNDARVLEQVIAASGAKYEGEQAMLWSKGSEATLELDGQAHTACREQEIKYPRPAADAFIAQGNEPGWRLEIHPGDRMELLADYGKTKVQMAAPPALPDGDATVYHARNAKHELSVRIEPTACEDDMSGARYTATVTVRLDGKALRGCGGTMTSAPGG
jgi:membrane-bound inhibitor of C-type lysozyme